jgi:hypothetical protein
MKICGMLGSNPFEWDDKNECLQVCTKISRKITFAIAVIQSLLYLCFLLWRLVELVHHPNPSFPAAVWQYIWINLNIWGLTTFYNGHTKKQEVVSFFRGLQLLAKKLKNGILQLFF